MRFNQLKVGVVLSYVGMIVQNIIAIVYTPIMLRLLGQSEYGLYQLVYSVVSYLGLLSFGFGSAYVRFYSRYKVKKDKKNIAKLNGMFMIVFVIIAIIALLAGGVLVVNISSLFSGSLSNYEIETARILMILMVINLAISFPSSVFDSYVTAHEQYFFQRILSLIQTVLNPFLTLPLLLMGYKSISLVIITTVLTVSKFVINYWYCIRRLNMHFIFNDFDFSLLKEIAIFSSYIFINMIVDQINWSVDKFILGVFGGTTAVAIYAVGGQINSMYINLSSSISSVFIPRVNKIVAMDESNNDELTYLFAKVGRIQFIILSLIIGGFIVVGKYFINIWAGDQYSNSFYVALLLIIPVTVPLIQNLGVEIQRAKNMHKFRSIVYFLIAVSNIFISIPLVKMFGEIGAAFGTCITMIIGNIILMNWYYQVKIELDMIYFWKQILFLMPCMVISIIFSCLLKSAIGLDSMIKFFIIGFSYVFIYVLCLFLFGMNQYEKDLIKKPLNKLIRRE